MKILEARKQRYLDALAKLTDADGFVPVVPLILAVPIERRKMSLLPRVITGGGANDYRTPERPNHNGIDFNAGVHAEGYAPMVNYLAEGATVTRSEFIHTSTSRYGNVVDISAQIPCMVRDLGKTARVTFRFGHMYDRTRKVGDRLRLWESFGTVGATGNATAPHKHFEVWIDGVRINPNHLAFQRPVTGLYTVQPGDTLSGIAGTFSTTVPQLQDWNRESFGENEVIIDPNQIKKFWNIWIIEPSDYSPPPGTEPPEEPPVPEPPEPIPPDDEVGNQYPDTPPDWDWENLPAWLAWIRVAIRRLLNLLGNLWVRLWPREYS